jgi:hypothetical protein
MPSVILRINSLYFVMFLFRGGVFKNKCIPRYEKYFHTMQNQQDDQDAPPGPKLSRCRLDGSGPSRHYDDERADRPLQNDHIFDIIFTRLERTLGNLELHEEGDFAEPFSTRIVIEEAKRHFKWDEEKYAIEGECFDAFLQYREVNNGAKNRQILQEMAYAFASSPEKTRKIMEYEPPYDYRGPYPNLPKIIKEIYDCFKHELGERPYYDDFDEMYPFFERILQKYSLSKNMAGLQEALDFRFQEFCNNNETLDIVTASMCHCIFKLFRI